MAKRWVLLEISVQETEEELADISVEGYIRSEMNWLNDSFDSVSILWIADSYEPDIQVEEE